MCALAEVARRGASTRSSSSRSARGSKTDPIPYEQARDWGRLEWAQPILDVVFDGVADTVDFQLQQLLPDGSYHRFQTELPRDIALDDARPGDDRRAARHGERLVRERSADIDAGRPSADRRLEMTPGKS